MPNLPDIGYQKSDFRKKLSDFRHPTSDIRTGFTLIEILVVITIIGILATFIVASFTSAQTKSRDARRKSDLDAVKKALELFSSDTRGSNYPSNSLSGLAANGYIKTMPQNPTGGNYYYLGGVSSGTCPGNALANAICTDYRLYTVLENTSDPQSAQSQTACPITGSFTVSIVSYPANTYVVCPH